MFVDVFNVEVKSFYIVLKLIENDYVGYFYIGWIFLYLLSDVIEVYCFM